MDYQKAHGYSHTRRAVSSCTLGPMGLQAWPRVLETVDVHWRNMRNYSGLPRMSLQNTGVPLPFKWWDPGNSEVKGETQTRSRKCGAPGKEGS